MYSSLIGKQKARKGIQYPQDSIGKAMFVPECKSFVKTSSTKNRKISKRKIHATHTHTHTEGKGVKR